MTRVRVVGSQVADNAWGFINKAAVLKIPDKYSYARSFSEGLAGVTGNDSGKGYIDHGGKIVIPLDLSKISDFPDGLAAICNDECVYINRSGTAVLPGVRAWFSFSDGLAVIGLEDPKMYIDKQGRVVAPYETRE